MMHLQWLQYVMLCNCCHNMILIDWHIIKLVFKSDKKTIHDIHVIKQQISQSANKNKHNNLYGI